MNGSLPQDPFPGLRPFEKDDSPYFFGREAQINQLIHRLRVHRFVAVIGESGSGKSSLVRAGLIPRLESGFLPNAGEHWHAIIFEPGRLPIRELARRLSELYRLRDREASPDLLEYPLRRNTEGLVECVRGAFAYGTQQNLLVVVDQFEEVFTAPDAALFVELLLEAARQEPVPIYILLTMRSSFLGRCQQFPGLPEMMNQAQFLVPRMNREELRLAITAPPRVLGKEISSALVEKLLNEISNDQDQLPVLQHALARTWEFWLNRADHSHTIELDPDYERTGGLAGALDQHAEDVLKTLSPNQASIATKLFQTITVEPANNELLRRPTTIADIVKIARGHDTLASLSEEELSEVIDRFRKQCNFLRPYISFEPSLNPETRIDISHESLMRKWHRVRTWIAEEHRTAHIYREVVSLARKYQHRQPDDKIWQDPDLPAALKRLETHGWSGPWAVQYGSIEEYVSAKKFLDKYRAESERAYRQIQLRQFLVQWTQVSLMKDPEEIYKAACTIAVDLLGADRSTFVEFEEGAKFGVVRAERTHPELLRSGTSSALNMTIPLTDPEERPLVEDQKPICYYNVESDVKAGRFKDNLRRLGVKSVLIVPVAARSLDGQNRSVIGSFSLDSVRNYRRFDESARELCELLAAQIAAALENARALEQERRRSDLLAKVDQYRGELGSIRIEDNLRVQILARTLDLCGWSTGVLYRRFDEHKLLRLGLEDRRSAPASTLWEPPVMLTEDSPTWLWKFVDEPNGQPYLNIDDATREHDPLLHGFARAVAIKLRSFDKLDSILLVLDNKTLRYGVEIDISFMVQFANRVAGRLERQSVVNSIGEELHLEVWRLLGPGPNSEDELRQTLHTFLTLVTARFGLGFNRAVVFLLTDRGDFLVSRAGIGQLSKQEWEVACSRDKIEGRDTLEGWRDTAASWVPTSLESWAMARHAFPIAGNALADVIESAQAQIPKILDADVARQNLPKTISDLLNPQSPVVLAALHSGRESIGLVIVDREFTRGEISERDVLALQVFCQQVAFIIRDYVRPSRIPDALHALLGEINQATSDRSLRDLDEESLLRVVARTTRSAFEAHGVRVIMIDPDRAVRLCIGDPDLVGTNQVSIDPTTARVLETGIAEIDEDLLDAHHWDPAIKLARCLPLFLGRRPVGVVWILYHSRLGVLRVDPASLQRYAAEASLVYANWLQVRNLSAQRRALQNVARARSFKEAAMQIVESTYDMFDARTVTFWPWDNRTQSFRGAIPFCKGFEVAIPEPTPGGTTYRILQERDHVFIDDVEKYEGFREHGTRTLGFLRALGIKSVEGVAIYTATEQLGVLFVGYGRTYPFGPNEVWALLDWATSVATILYTIKVLETERKVHEAAQDAALFLAKGSLDLTLQKLADTALELLRCGTVTIHRYNDETRRPEFPPVIAGVRDPQRLKRQDRRDAYELVPRLIELGACTVALNEEELQLWFPSRFIYEEDIRASVALRLEFAKRWVGIMFVSFRNELHRQELDSILDLASLFARHAAVAIGSNQRSEDLSSLSATLLAGEPTILQEALRTVKKHLRPDRCNIVIREGGRLRSVAEIGWADGHQEDVEVTSHAGFSIATHRPIAFSNIRDVAKDPLLKGFEPPQRLLDAEIQSGLAVPILCGDSAEGALLVHMKEQRAFSTEDISFLTMVANQLMMAYLGAQRVRAIKAEFAAARVIASGSYLDEFGLLDDIRDVVLKFLTDEKGQPKLVEVWIALRGGSKPSKSGDFSVPVRAGADHVGIISGSIRHDRSLGSEDMDILRGIADLTGIALRQIRDHRDSTITMASLTDHLGAQLRRLRLRLDEIQDGVKRRSLTIEIEGLDGVRADLENLETINRRIAHTIRALENPVDLDMRPTEAYHLGDLVRNVYEQARSEASQKGIDLRSPTLKIGRREVRVDEAMIAAVAGNLVDNAIRFTPPGGWIDCRAFEDVLGVNIEIQDSGRGLEDEEQEQVFNPFDRAVPGRKHVGVKIGLPNCQRVMELHGGRMEVRSSGANLGSTFAIRVPWMISSE